MSDSGRSPRDLQHLPTQEEAGAGSHPGHSLLHADDPALPGPVSVYPEPQCAVRLLDSGQHHHPGEHDSDF